MKGLLHRLAAQATGAAVAVHSDVRLPFATVAILESTAARSFDISEKVMNAGDRATRPVGMTEATHFTPAVDPPILPTAPTPLLEVAMRRSDTSTPDIAGAAANQSNDTHPHPRAVAMSPEAASFEPQPLLPQRSIGAHEANADVASRGPDPAKLPAMTQRESRMAQPSLLLPSRPEQATGLTVTSTQSSRPAVTPGPASRATADDEPHEVHIHIGRIDVTAVQETAAPRRRPAPATAPMTLDNYFAKRGRT